MVTLEKPASLISQQNSKISSNSAAAQRKCEQVHYNNLHRQLLAELLLNICEECTRMAALPQAGFAACKLREHYHDRDLIVSRLKTGDTKNITENKKLLEYSPVKYNGKLMNSIWGFYNRYSPHNIKGNEYESSGRGYFLQQPTAVASSTTAKNLAVEQSSGKDGFLEKFTEQNTHF